MYGFYLLLLFNEKILLTQDMCAFKKLILNSLRHLILFRLMRGGSEILK